MYLPSFLPEDPLGDLWVAHKNVVTRKDQQASKAGSKYRTPEEQEEFDQWVEDQDYEAKASRQYDLEEEARREEELAELEVQDSYAQEWVDEYYIYKNEYWSYTETEDWTGYGTEPWNADNESGL